MYAVVRRVACVVCVVCASMLVCVCTYRVTDRVSSCVNGHTREKKRREGHSGTTQDNVHMIPHHRTAAVCRREFTRDSRVRVRDTLAASHVWHGLSTVVRVRRGAIVLTFADGH